MSVKSVLIICSLVIFFVESKSYIDHYRCLKKGCITHQSVCACSNPKISLYIRYNNEEL